MKADLLIAVKVANDFKVEAQLEKQALLAKITKLQNRRSSLASVTSLQNNEHSAPVTEFSQPYTWEKAAWTKLSESRASGKFF